MRPPPLYETLIQGETEGGRWIQRETGEIEGDRGYRGIQYTNDMLTQHISRVLDDIFFFSGSTSESCNYHIP